MSKPSTQSYAYFLLLSAPDLDALRVGLARSFPLHITLRGRFTPEATRGVTELIAIGRDALRAFSPISCALTGPIRTGRLVWYEASGPARCVGQVQSMHLALERSLHDLGMVVHDHVPSGYALGGYRPHVTISLGDVAPSDVAPSHERFKGLGVGWALYEYDGWESTSPARIVYSEDLDGPEKRD